MENVSNRIRERRERMNMTQEDIATRIGVSRVMVSYFESGLRKPDIETALRLARVLECTTDDLFELRTA